MIRTLRLLAIPATVLATSTAIAGPYDAYKPPAVPPATTMPVQVAQNDTVARTTNQDVSVQDTKTETTGTQTTETRDVETVAQNESMQPIAQDSYVPPGPGEVVIMDQSATTVVEGGPVYQQQYQQPVYQSQPRTYQAQPQRQRPMQRLMDLERRKNAWLRKTFLNR